MEFLLMKIVEIMPMRAGSPATPYQIPPEAVAMDEIQAEREATCQTCPSNKNNRCTECCGGVPISTKKRLLASRCEKQLWKR